MYCKQCGTNLPQGAAACPSCGAAVTPPYAAADTAGPYTPPGQPASGQQPYIPATPQPPIKPYTFPGADEPAGEAAPAGPAPAPVPAPDAPATAPAGTDIPEGTAPSAGAAPTPADIPAAPPVAPPAAPLAAPFSGQGEAAPAPAAAGVPEGSPAPAAPATGLLSWSSDGAPAGPPQYAPYNPHAAPPAGGQVPPGGQLPAGDYGPGGMPPAWQAAPPAPAKKRKTGLIVAIVLVAVACIAVLLVLLLGGDPKKQLRNGMENTFSTLGREAAGAMEKTGLGGFADALHDGPAQVDLAMDIDLQGEFQMALSGTTHLDNEAEKAEAEMRYVLNGSVIEMQVGVDGDLVAVSLPGLLDGSYGLHTKTLGRDYNNSFISDLFDLYIDPDFSYDFFAGSGAEVDLDGAASLTAAGTAIVARYGTLWDAITVTRDGSEEVTVNGAVKKCAAYDMVLPRDAFITFLRDCHTILADEDTRAALEEQGGEASITPELLDELKELVDAVEAGLDGDITGRCWLLNKRLVRAELAIPAGGQTYDATLQFGGENALGDALDITVAAGNRTLFGYASEGDTTLRDGVYTNKVTLQAAGDSGTTRATVSLRYDPAAQQDNFSCTLSVPNVLLTANIEGTITVDKAAKTGTADLHTITVDVAGERLSMDFFYEVSPSEGHTFAPLDPVMVFDMTEEEFYTAYYELMMGFLYAMGMDLF